MNWFQLLDDVRFALYDIMEDQYGALRGMCGEKLVLYMKPSEDGLGWSRDALTLHLFLVWLGFEPVGPPFWKKLCTCSQERPWAGRDGYMFDAVYRVPEVYPRRERVA